MAEKVDTQPGGLRDGFREGLHELREDVSRDRIESKLDDKMSERPLVKFLLDWGVVLRALAIAAVLTLIVSLLLSPRIGAVILVLSFAIGWVAIAARKYNERRPTKPVDTDE
jgi:hypothetical protein